jgi:hypothetical protein
MWQNATTASNGVGLPSDCIGSVCKIDDCKHGERAWHLASGKMIKKSELPRLPPRPGKFGFEICPQDRSQLRLADSSILLQTKLNDHTIAVDTEACKRL